ncbi:MAG: Crp/Fnr family transcriptional regulator [Gammaproteobacteria bacterium]|nr:Crp/Fnr family transcriptional regulator [Gammaproteobacteria bacterium]
MHTVDRTWLASFPQLSKIETKSWHYLLEKVKRTVVQPGEMVFRNGDLCNHYLFVLSGIVRVQKISLSGNEITLYRIHSGEACEITTSCLLAHDMYHAEAIAETEVTAIFIPSHYFLEALKDSEILQHYVYSNVEHGVNSLLELLGEIAFESVDARLARSLLKNCNNDNTVLTTHHELAANLGTAREVISRMLKRFETRGWVTLRRGKIILHDLKSLEKLSLNQH